MNKSSSKHFVLVPGLWHGGWAWDRVAPLLRMRGHQVTAITQTGVGERSHLLSEDINITTFVEDVVNTLIWREFRDVVLVGHSFGGISVTGAADLVPDRIGKLIYLDGAVMENGETWFGLLPYDIMSARIKQVQGETAALNVPPPPPERLGITDPKDKAFLEARMTPHPFNTFTTRLNLKHEIGNGLPVEYIACVDPVYPPAVSAHKRAREKGWRISELKTGHEAMVLTPAETAELLDKLGLRQGKYKPSSSEAIGQTKKAGSANIDVFK